MKVISITGGIGSGKSEVLRLLKEEFDAAVIVADQVAHQLMEPGKKGYLRVVGALGTSFLNADGSIDKKSLAELIFKDKEAIKKMNEIIHPMAWQEIRYGIDHSDKELVVVEAALLDEEHNAMFDEVWYVYTSEENRIKRLMKSRNYSKEKCYGIMKNQASEEEFRRLADQVINNNGTLDEVRDQLREILKED